MKNDMFPVLSICLLFCSTAPAYAQDTAPAEDTISQKTKRMEHLICQQTELTTLREDAQRQLEATQSFVSLNEARREELVASLKADAAIVTSKALDEAATFAALELEELTKSDEDLTERIDALTVYVVQVTRMEEEAYRACLRKQRFDGSSSLPSLADMPPMPDGTEYKPLSKEDRKKGQQLLERLGLKAQASEPPEPSPPKPRSATQKNTRAKVEIASDAAQKGEACD